MSKVISFLKSRPTETWLGLWTVIVAVLAVFGVDIEAAVSTAAAAVVAWLTTFLASRDSNSLGPQPSE